MAIELIPEDGTGVADANTYVVVADFRTYAANRGVVLSANDDDVAMLLIQAMDYLELLDYLGDPTTTTQALSWPRTYTPPTDDEFQVGWDYPFGAFIQTDDTTVTPPFQPNEIPTRLKNAEMQLALAIKDGFIPLANNDGQFIISDKTGPLETKYSEWRSSSQPSLPMVDALLDPLIVPSSASLTASVGRA